MARAMAIRPLPNSLVRAGTDLLVVRRYSGPLIRLGGWVVSLPPPVRSFPSFRLLPWWGWAVGGVPCRRAAPCRSGVVVVP